MWTHDERPRNSGTNLVLKVEVRLRDTFVDTQSFRNQTSASLNAGLIR